MTSPRSLSTTCGPTQARGSFTDEKVYVVQTNVKIVQRCLLMCTDPGDLVLDPTCGSGTTAFVAEQWGRRWVTIDTSRVALALSRQRLMGAKYPYYLLSDSPAGVQKEQEVVASHFRGPLPTATSARVRVRTRPTHHPEVDREQPGRQRRHEPGRDRCGDQRYADYELLYDKPYEDKSKIRCPGRSRWRAFPRTAH